MIRDVAVVIPMYRENLTSSENVALSQVKHVLYDYPIYLIMPKKMEKNNLFPELYKEFFSDEYFVSTKSYSKLMMETDFYKRFNNYKYILIYQLDAFVFSDRLKEFCAFNYDYIGAPTPRSQWKYCGRIGNGGFSLRKVEKCISVTIDKERIFRMSGMEDAFLECEDKFFGYCGVSKNIDFTVPDVKTALRFSIENNIAHCHEHLDENDLPFGCHGWSKSYNYPLWKKYIERFGYDLKQTEKEIFSNGFTDRKRYIYELFFSCIYERILRQKKCEISIRDDILPSKYKYVLWGMGKVGERAYELMKLIKREVFCFFDRKNCENFMDKKVVYPDVDFVCRKGLKIVITTNMYGEEIKEELETNGLKENIDYYVYSKIEFEIIRSYCQDKMKRIRNMDNVGVFQLH